MQLLKNKKLINYSIFVLVVIILVCIGFIFSSSYSYTDMPKTGLNDSEILNCLEISNENINTYLSSINYVPDNNGLVLKPYKIKITNKCDAYITYNATIKITNNTFDLNNIYYNITEDDYLLDSINNLGSSNNQDNTYLLYIGDLNANTSETLDLKMWTNSDNTSLVLNGDLSVEPLHSLDAAPHGWYASKEGSLMNNIKANYKISATKTTPGKESSALTEKVLASTTDSEGESYYFRGSIDNNYVLFANKCWRIVRITGNGSIKLVLYNDNKYNAPNACNFGLDESDAAFALYTSNTYQSIFNSKTNDNAYVGYLYGKTNSKDLKSTHQNKNTSIIMKNLENWYLNNIFKYDYYLTDQNTCVDKSLSNVTINSENLSNLGYGDNNTWYNVSNRIINSNPSLECDKTYILNTSNGLNYKVGLLSADEVALAGGSYEKTNTSYYLYHNAYGSNWWTISPAVYYNGANVWRVGASGGLYYSEVNNSYALRPTVSLKSNIKVTGLGTSSNPYIVSLYN